MATWLTDKPYYLPEDNPDAPPMWQGAGINWLFKIKKIGT